MLNRVKVDALRGNEYWYIDCHCGEVLRHSPWPKSTVKKGDTARCRDCWRCFEFDGNDWYCIESVPEPLNLYGYPIGKGPEEVQRKQRWWIEHGQYRESVPDELQRELEAWKSASGGDKNVPDEAHKWKQWSTWDCKCGAHNLGDNCVCYVCGKPRYSPWRSVRDDPPASDTWVFVLKRNGMEGIGRRPPTKSFLIMHLPDSSISHCGDGYWQPIVMPVVYPEARGED